MARASIVAPHCTAHCSGMPVGVQTYPDACLLLDFALLTRDLASSRSHVSTAGRRDVAIIGRRNSCKYRLFQPRPDLRNDPTRATDPTRLLRPTSYIVRQSKHVAVVASSPLDCAARGCSRLRRSAARADLIQEAPGRFSVGWGTFEGTGSRLLLRGHHMPSDHRRVPSRARRITPIPVSVLFLGLH